jgi:hypothetical protein
MHTLLYVHHTLQVLAPGHAPVLRTDLVPFPLNGQIHGNAAGKYSGPPDSSTTMQQGDRAALKLVKAACLSLCDATRRAVPRHTQDPVDVNICT